MNGQEIENEINEKGLTAPRVTPDMVNEAIMSAKYHRFENTTVTVCCLILKNGFTVIGESACASPENFDEELGKKIAYDSAKQQVWKLEGYALRERLHEMSKGKAA